MNEIKKKLLIEKDLKILRKKFLSKKIGLVHGVFDLFHYGHILHLEKAKTLCDILVVSITADKFISKGPGRPFYNNNQRKKLIASMSQVDYVVLSENKSAVEIIDALKPNLYFKGSDYKDFNKDYSKKILKETDAVKRNKGAFFLTNEKTFSSTKLINNYSDNFDPNVKKFLLKSSKEFSFDKIFNIFKKVEKLKILIIGEMIIDKYTFTTPLGKSPKEQLVPVKIKKSETYGGGVIATANHISNFVKDCTVLSIIGNMEKDKNMILNLINKKVKKQIFVNEESKNIIKHRYIDSENNNKLFQVSSISEISINTEKEKKILNYLKKNIKYFDQIIVHDFGQGLISDKIIKFLQKYNSKLSVNVQTNSSNIGYNYITKYSKLNYFSIDEPEARLALQDKISDSRTLMKKLAKKIEFKFGTITFGKYGSNIFDKKDIYFVPALTTKPIDTMGAGDAHFAISSLLTKVSKDIKLISFVGNVAGALKIQFIGHRKSIQKVDFFNFIKSVLNI